jgi:hypothetical protein
MLGQDKIMTKWDKKFIKYINSLSSFDALNPKTFETPFNKKLSEEVLELLQDKINWSWVSYSQILSEDFIRKFRSRVSFYYISRYQKLSEEFIEEFSDRIFLEDIPLCLMCKNHKQSWKTFL